MLLFLSMAGCNKQSTPCKEEQPSSTTLPSDNNQDVKIQMLTEVLNMAGDMAIMMATQEGASMANARLTTEGQLLATTVNTGSQTIQTNMQSFQKQAQVQQQAELQTMISAFSQAQANIQKQTQQAFAVSNAELNYLYQNISLDQPQQNYIFNQIQFDQLFSAGTMLTPQGAVWKNPFSVGDWEYDKDTDSFWQYQSSPITNSVTDDAGVTTTSSLQAENNSIFTEYVTTANSYKISGTMTLYSVTYPFFAGIIFNKARWISGDFEAIRKCRMMGIYATSANDIGLYFAQQYTMTDAQLQAAPNQTPIQTPLQQILNQQVKKQIDLSTQKPLDGLAQGPVVMEFEITTTATKVFITITFGTNTPVTTTISNLDSSLFMYHGIGCISPSAITSFHFTQPSDLIFSSKAILNYKE